jgi:hypothetical protein
VLKDIPWTATFGFKDIYLAFLTPCEHNGAMFAVYRLEGISVTLVEGITSVRGHQCGGSHMVPGDAVAIINKDGLTVEIEGGRCSEKSETI